MQYTTLALGAFIIFYSVSTLYLSLKDADKQIRLVYMKNKLGKFWGATAHLLIYVIIPLVFGSFMLNAGFNGTTITNFITR